MGTRCHCRGQRPVGSCGGSGEGTQTGVDDAGAERSEKHETDRGHDDPCGLLSPGSERHVESSNAEEKDADDGNHPRRLDQAREGTHLRHLLRPPQGRRYKQPDAHSNEGADDAHNVRKSARL